MAERQGLEPWTPMKVRLFSRQRPRPAGRAPFVKWLPDVDSHHDEPLNRRPCYFHITGECGAPGRIFACMFPLRRRVPDTFGHGSNGNGRAPRCCPECLLVPSEADCCLPRARTRCVVLKMAACAGIAPATFRSTGGCSS